MRKWIVITGLIILIIGVFPLILGNLGMGTRLDRFSTGESRFPVLMILLIALGITLMIVGFVLPKSKSEGNGFRMGF